MVDDEMTLILGFMLLDMQDALEWHYVVLTFVWMAENYWGKGG